MARVTSQEAAQRWSQGVSQNINRYTEGVMKVSQAPGQAAAAKDAKYQAGLAASHASGKWKNAVARVSLSDWQQATATIGGPRLAQGAAANVGKMEAAMAQVLPAVDAARSKVRAMPDTTLEDRIARSGAFAREMAKFQKR